MENILEEISQKNFDKQKYANLVISNEELRDFVVENMITHPEIMKYYHCYYIIQKASTLQPELFYKYWDSLCKLLKYPNSYHRNFGLTILAKLAKVDRENKFDDIIEDYLGLLNDEKIMTVECCVNNCFVIASDKKTLQKRIVDKLLNVDNFSQFQEKQKALMASFVIEGFELIIDVYPDRQVLIDFVKEHTSTISPKTNKVAKRFLTKHG